MQKWKLNHDEVLKARASNEKLDKVNINKVIEKTDASLAEEEE